MSFLNNAKANELHFHEPRWNPPLDGAVCLTLTTHTVCDNAQIELVISQVGEVKGPRTLLSGSTPLISPWPALWVLPFPDRSRGRYSPAPACSCSNPSPADLSGWTTWCTCKRGSSGSRPSHTCPAGGPSSRGNGSAGRRESELRSHLLAVTKQNEQERTNTLRDSYFTCIILKEQGLPPASDWKESSEEKRSLLFLNLSEHTEKLDPVHSLPPQERWEVGLLSGLSASCSEMVLSLRSPPTDLPPSFFLHGLPSTGLGTLPKGREFVDAQTPSQPPPQLKSLSGKTLSRRAV